MRLINAWERPAYYLDLYRVMPRMALAGYGYMAWQVALWFMGLKDPTVAQAGFPSVVYGAAPFIMNFYMQNGINWEARRSVELRSPPTASVAPIVPTPAG